MLPSFSSPGDEVIDALMSTEELEVFKTKAVIDYS